MDIGSCYVLLGIGETDDIRKIRAAYRRKALEFHPDKTAVDPQAFQRIVEAYQTLTSHVFHKNEEGEGTMFSKQTSSPGFRKEKQESGAKCRQSFIPPNIAALIKYHFPHEIPEIESDIGDSQLQSLATRAVLLEGMELCQNTLRAVFEQYGEIENMATFSQRRRAVLLFRDSSSVFSTIEDTTAEWRMLCKARTLAHKFDVASPTWKREYERLSISLAEYEGQVFSRLLGKDVD